LLWRARAVDASSGCDAVADVLIVDGTIDTVGPDLVAHRDAG
jgi:hypothetical protein